MTLQLGGFTTLVQVFDMPTSLAFYCDVLGFTVVNRWPEQGPCDWAMLKLAGSELMLNTAYDADQRPPAPDPSRVAVHSDVVHYFDCDDVAGAFAYLSERGVVVTKPTTSFYGMKQMYLKDPDGYELCLQQPIQR